MQADDIIKSSRFAGQVKRYHTWVTIQTQSNAEHSWQVARVYEALFGPPPAHVEQWIRWHDAGEIRTGDLPFPIKSQHPDLKAVFDSLERQAVTDLGVELSELTQEERDRVKLCDLLEMWEFGTVEVAMGNRMGNPVVDRTRDAIQAILVAKFGGDLSVAERVGAHYEKVRRWTR